MYLINLKLKLASSKEYVQFVQSLNNSSYYIAEDKQGHIHKLKFYCITSLKFTRYQLCRQRWITGVMYRSPWLLLTGLFTALCQLLQFCSIKQLTMKWHSRGAATVLYPCRAQLYSNESSLEFLEARWLACIWFSCLSSVPPHVEAGTGHYKR